MAETRTIWTVGHSDAELDDLFRLLAAQGIDTIVDVRSSPYSKFVPQANRECVEAAARNRGVTYIFRGGELGGRPDDAELYTAAGKADYERMADSDDFRRGLAGLVELAGQQRVCILCSEEDPERCHRGLLVAEQLARAGQQVLHLRHDGSVETHAAMMKRHTGGQLSLF